MVVAGADMHVATQATSLLADDECCLGMCFEATYSKGDSAPTRSSSAAQCKLRSSSKRALISITQATCFPCSAARMSDLTNGVSSPIR